MNITDLTNAKPLPKNHPFKTIWYSAKGKPVSDFDITKTALQILTDDELITSHSLVIEAIRILVKYGKLDYNQVELRFNKFVIHVDKNGRSNDWPEGFCDIYEELARKLL